MATERENIPTSNGLGTLRVRAYDIAGNKIRAFYDASGQIIFIIDDTITPEKPNALLIINSDDDRKWDEILTKDYGVSLEVVRPKKDNKYQKLDIEYIGLDEYSDLIDDFEDGEDMAQSLAALTSFRMDASRRAATERLGAAEVAAENARETIANAQDSIADLQSRLKTLRAKLGQQRKAVGREPTKQSAAKILRTESQIDAIKDKQQRAQRRLDNARRRLVSADEVAEFAREILARLPAENKGGTSHAGLPAVPAPRAVATVRERNDLPVPAAGDVNMPVVSDVKQVIAEQSEPKARRMAEEVKPLFDKDPEILDEEIAFKPIDFNVNITPSATAAQPVAPRFDDYSDAGAPAPLSFTPPVTDVDIEVPQAMPARPAPVLDSITSVEMPATAQPVSEPFVSQAPAYDAGANVADMARPAPITPAVPGRAGNDDTNVRPVSPVTGMAAQPVGGGGNTNGRKPTFMYYVLLIALIVLSIFTLWLYQKKNNDTVPDLAATTVEQKQQADVETVPAGESPFISVEETVTVTPEPAPTPVVTPEPIVEEVPQVPAEPVVPVIDETVPAIEVVPEQAPVEMPEETPFLTEPAPAPEPVKPVVVNKPAYNAGSQNENMFVADAGYETETVMPSDSMAAPVQYQDTVVTSQYSVSDGPTCDDGAMPDTNGCCGDERYTDIGGGAYACCSQSTGDCYPPMF